MSMYRPDTGDNELNQSRYGWKPEQEIRFVVDEFDRSVLENYANPTKIEQAYFPTAPHLTQRVRIINRDIAVLTKKIGWGETRGELEVEEIDPVLARVMHDELCLYGVSKTRYGFIGGWELDVYDKPAGLVILEYEGKDTAVRRRQLPPWVRQATEITNIATNTDIARWTHEQAAGLLQCSVRDMLVAIPLVVLAGGPGSGKSTLFNGLRERMPTMATFVVEAARMLIDNAGHQPPVGDEIAMNRFERGIYDLHRLLTGLAEDRARKIGARMVVSDRHQVDVYTYLGADRARFEQVCDTLLDYEYTKGDLVIYCGMPSREVYEAVCVNDGVRWETYDQAVETDRRLREVYAGFGDRVVEVPFMTSKAERLNWVMNLLIHGWLPNGGRIRL